MKERDRGIISIFLALIMLPTYLFSVGSLDFARMYAGKSYIRLADEAALSSLILNYNKKLYEEYDLLAVNDAIMSNKITEEVIKSNLDNQEQAENFNRFLNIKSNLTLKEDSGLNNPYELERQIADYMRFKAPLELGKGFLNLFDSVRNAKVYNKIISKKMEYNEELLKLNNGLVTVENLFLTYKGDLDLLQNLMNQYLVESNSLSKLYLDRKATNEKLEAKEEKTLEDLETIAANKALIEEKTDEFISKFQDLGSKVKNQIIIITNLSQNVKKINDKNDKLDQNLKAWEESINTSPSEDIKKQLRSEFTFSNKAFSKDNINKLIIKLDEEKKVLVNFFEKYFSEEGTFVRFSKERENYNLLSLTEQELASIRFESLDDLPLFKTLITNKSSLKIDAEKKHAALSLKNLLDNFNSKENTQEVLKDNLFNYITKDDFNSIMKASPNELYASNKLIDLPDIKAINNSLSLINLDQNINSAEFINNFYISQYIDEKFSDKLTEVNGKIMGQKEFIIFGSADLAANIRKVNQIIFAMRFALNSLYAFTSPQVRKDALMMATSLAGWSGIGVPIVEALLISSMSLGESILDSRKLADGQDISLFKNRASWTFSLDGIKRLASEEAIKFSKTGIANIMDSLEQVALEASNSSFESLNQFIAQTGDGVVQGLTGTIILPIQNLIVELINEPSQTLGEDIKSMFNSIKNKLANEENPVIKSFLTKLINDVEINYSSKLLTLLSNRETLDNDAIMNLINSISADLEAKVQLINNKYGAELRGKVSEAIKSSKKDYQNKISHAIEEYLAKFGSNKNSKATQFSKSGLSFRYADYLKLLSMVKLSGHERDNILKRIALVIDIEMKQMQPQFSILDTYTSFNIKTQADIPIIIGAFADDNKRRTLSDELSLGFRR